jgi:hypothetical protein
MSSHQETNCDTYTREMSSMKTRPSRAASVDAATTTLNLALANHLYSLELLERPTASSSSFHRLIVNDPSTLYECQSILRIHHSIRTGPAKGRTMQDGNSCSLFAVVSTSDIIIFVVAAPFCQSLFLAGRAQQHGKGSISKMLSTTTEHVDVSLVPFQQTMVEGLYCQVPRIAGVRQLLD